MSGQSAEKLRTLISEKAAAALSLPGVLAIEPGVRKKAGRTVPHTQAVVVTVERKVAPQRLADEEDLRRLFGAENVDVVEATPLKALFARPEKYGVDVETLAQLESRVGYPFLPDAVGVRPPQLLSTTLVAAARRAEITYRPPAGVKLDPLNGKIRLRCHAGPDAGWKELSTFLRVVQRELVVGMYELTAPHIGDLLAEEIASRVQTFKLTMDKKVSIGSDMKRWDRTEEQHARMFADAFGDGFEHAYAFTSKTGGGTFYTDYHIKLAVRDRKAFWLSSGSWQSSNQPNLNPLGPDRTDRRLPKCNREWHVIGEHEGVSKVWAEFLEWDLKTAQMENRSDFAPAAAMLTAAGPFIFLDVRNDEFPYEEFWDAEEFEFTAGQGGRVVPLLTPDNYIETVTDLVAQARKELLVQNQSLAFHRSEDTQDDRYTEFTRLLARKSHELKQFRLIVRDPAEFGGSAEDQLDIYRSKGFDTDKIRFQPRCHNKGIIADGEKVLIGSHNFTSAGMTVNRDASLLVEHANVAGYYRKFFEHDWKVAGKVAESAVVRPRPRMLIAAPGELPGPGLKAYSLWELLDAD